MQRSTQTRDLRTAVLAGLEERAPAGSDALVQLALTEVDRIEALEAGPYFLAVADVVQHARRERIRVGPGLGSSASSAVNYALGITSVDPTRYGLHPARMLPMTSNVVDIGIAVDSSRAPELLDYIRSSHPDYAAVTGAGAMSTHRPGGPLISVWSSDALTVLDRCLESTAPVRGRPSHTSEIPLDDASTLASLARGGLPEMTPLHHRSKQFLADAVADRIEDVFAAMVLMRPDPVAAGLPEQYIARKHGRTPVACIDSTIEDIVAESCGLILYQEQLMSIAMRVAAYTASDAERLRRGLGKAPVRVQAEREQFLAAVACGGLLPRERAEALFDHLDDVYPLTLVKAHAVGCGLVAYWLAYLNVHFPDAYQSSLRAAGEASTE